MAEFASTRLLALAAALALGGCASRPPVPEPLDLVLEHGAVVDGTGAPRTRADVGLRGDRVVWVGDLTAAPTRRRIDVSGWVVTPGFIDLLDAANLSILVDGREDPGGTYRGEARSAVLLFAVIP